LLFKLKREKSKNNLMNKIRKILLFAIFIPTIHLSLSADVITLKNGQIIEGKTREFGDNLEVTTRRTRLLIPRCSIETIEKKEYQLNNESDSDLTPEEIRRRKAEDLFEQARRQFDRLNTTEGISLLEKAVKTDPGFDRALELLVSTLARRGNYIKARSYLNKLKEIALLSTDMKELEGEIEVGYRNQLEREKMSGKRTGASLYSHSLLPMGGIPEAPPAADYSGSYYLEYSYLIQVQQQNNLATIAVYSQNASAPSMQFSAVVKGNFLIPDLSRINPTVTPGSIIGVFHEDSSSYSLVFRGNNYLMVGKKIALAEERMGFLSLLSGNTGQAIGQFESAIKKDPSNSHILFGLGRAFMLSGRAEEAVSCFDRVKDDEVFPSYLFMEKYLRISRDYAEAKIMSSRSQNAIDDYEEAFNRFPLRRVDFGAFLEIMTGKKKMDAFAAKEAKKQLDPYARSFQAIENTYQKPFCRWPVDGSLSAIAFPNTTNYIKLSKLMLVKAKKTIYEKDFEEAIRDCSRVLRMGQHLNHGPLPIRFLGIQIETFGIEAFRELISAVETPEQVDAVASALCDILQKQPPYDYQSLVSYERVEWPNVDKSIYAEATLKARVDLTPLDMLKVGVAAKKYYLENNRLWPASPHQLVPRYLKNPPLDPFGKDILKIFSYPSGFRIYSVGPDRVDDNGNLPYNPEKGLKSPGDILIDIH